MTNHTKTPIGSSSQVISQKGTPGHSENKASIYSNKKINYDNNYKFYSNSNRTQISNDKNNPDLKDTDNKKSITSVKHIPRKPKSGNLIIGSKSDCSITGKPRMFHYCISRVGPSTTTEDLKKFVKNLIGS
jgi:hypothetical protein